MYRPFVTCDDPKGFVDGGAIRKNKTGSQKEEHKMKIRSRANKTDTNPSSVLGKEKMVQNGSAEKGPDPSFLQLVEVSRGAQKLNQMVGSWSDRLQYDGWNKDIAKDLLKGALDLQESLVMLHKLQEASKYKAYMKKKRSQKPERSTSHKEVFDRTCPDQFTDSSYMTGLQKPRLSYDASSRNSVEELKKVIKESFIRQNLYPTSNRKQLDNKFVSLDSASEVPSTSSSHSSDVPGRRQPTDSPPLSSISSSQKMEKGPGVIAKLMGLQELPSNPTHPTLQKQLDSEKILNQHRPMLELGMPQVRRSRSTGQYIDPEHKTLREVLGTMHFKGLLNNNCVREHKLQIQNSNKSHPKERSLADALPIVLIRPFRTPHCNPEEHIVQLPEEEEEEALEMKFVSKKPKAADAFPRTIDYEESSLSLSKVHGIENTCTISMSQAEQPKHDKQLGKPDRRELKLKERTPDKGKLHTLVKEIDMVEKKTKVKISNRKPPEKEIEKARKIVSGSQDRSEITKLRQPGILPRVNKNENLRQQSKAPKTTSKSRTQQIISSKEPGKNPARKRRPARKTARAKLVGKHSAEKTQEDVKTILPCEDSIQLRATSSVKENEGDVCPNKIGEYCSNGEESLADDTLQTPPIHESEATPAEDGYNSIGSGGAGGKGAKGETDIKVLLLSNESLIKHAEELFILGADWHCPSLQISKTNTSGIENSTVLYSDYASEYMQQKSLAASQTGHTWSLTCMGSSRLCISLDKLVEEICDGIENLKANRNISGGSLSVDGLYALMERDIRCGGMVNGIWDSGWRHGFSADEAELVVSDILKQVLTGLIEEVITQFSD